MQWSNLWIKKEVINTLDEMLIELTEYRMTLEKKLINISTNDDTLEEKFAKISVVKVYSITIKILIYLRSFFYTKL